MPNASTARADAKRPETTPRLEPISLLIDRNAAAYNAWSDVIEYNDTRKMDEQLSTSGFLQDWESNQKALLERCPRSLDDVVAVARHLLPHAQREHLDMEDMIAWVTTLSLSPSGTEGGAK